MKKTNLAIFILSLLGIALTIYLWAFQVSDKIIPCSDDGCAHVLNDPSSIIFGVPMSAYGFAFYIAIAYLAFQRFFIKANVVKHSMTLLLASGLIFSLYLRYLEFFKIGSICQWCWASFIIVIFLTTIHIYELIKNE